MLTILFLSLVNGFRYPETKEVNYTYEMHDVSISDPYIWLEDIENSDVKAWIKAQNNLALSTLKGLKGYKKLYREIDKSWKRPYVSLPTKRGNYFFFYKDDGKSNHSVLYVSMGCAWNPRKGKKLIDPNKFSKDGHIALDFAVPSLDGEFVAFGKSFGGSENSTLYILDVSKGKVLRDSIPDTKWTSIAWLRDNSGFYYTRNTEKDKFRPFVYFHKVGTPYEEDEYVFGKELPETWSPSVYTDRSGRFLFLSVEKGWAENDLYVKDLTKAGEFISVARNLKGTFEAKVYGDQLYILTNWNAPRYRILRTTVNAPGVETAEEIIPEGSYVIENFEIAGKKIVLRILDSTFTRLIVTDLDGKFDHEITLPQRGTAYFTIEDENSPVIYISYSSFLYPPTIFHYDLENRMLTKVWQMKVKFKPEDYEQKFVLYSSKDGAKVPMYIIHKRGIRLDGRNPALLTGYGGFNVSMRPRFMGDDLFVKRGFVLAIACLRGGGEFGEEWHRMGMRENKQNVFDDFISAAEYLISEGYTNPEKLVISGGSNGGLLVGAVMAQRPDLFKAVYCGVPLLDMVRYHKFGVAHIWIPEYGNPENPDDFKYIYEYSPYHRIDKNREKIFPSVFFHTAEFDGRVHPSHAMKMAAKMQSKFRTKGPVLLYVEPLAGHGAGKPRKQELESATLRAIYLFWQLDVEQ
jgi:prolyl oligopeptidase